MLSELTIHTKKAGNQLDVESHKEFGPKELNGLKIKL